MPRSPEQIKADDALTDAIQRTLDAYFGDSPEVLMEYVIVVAQQGYVDGQDQHTFSTLYRDGLVSMTRSLGLLDAASSSLRNSMVPVARPDNS